MVMSTGEFNAGTPRANSHATSALGISFQRPLSPPHPSVGVNYWTFYIAVGMVIAFGGPTVYPAAEATRQKEEKS